MAEKGWDEEKEQMTEVKWGLEWKRDKRTTKTEDGLGREEGWSREWGAKNEK